MISLNKQRKNPTYPQNAKHINNLNNKAAFYKESFDA